MGLTIISLILRESHYYYYCYCYYHYYYYYYCYCHYYERASYRLSPYGSCATMLSSASVIIKHAYTGENQAYTPPRLDQ